MTPYKVEPGSCRPHARLSPIDDRPQLAYQIAYLSYDDGVTVHEVLIQYESRLQELQAGLTQVRMQHLATATVLIVAAALFLTLGVYAIRQRIPLWWPSLPIPIAAASARRYRRLGLAGRRKVVTPIWIPHLGSDGFRTDGPFSSLALFAFTLRSSSVTAMAT